ncbi:MAG: hypothetical protein WHS38_05940 [Thermodesulforhabdaceae bacterium]
MKNLLKILTIFIFLAFLASGCASVPGAKPTSLVNDLGSPKKSKLLEQRASLFWTAMVKGDLKEAYKYYDPFLRSKMSVEEFITKHGLVKYHEFKITGVKVEGNIGTIKVKVKYSVPKTKIKQLEASVPETTQELEERWLFIYDEWYKEYYLKFFETGAAFY